MKKILVETIIFLSLALICGCSSFVSRNNSNTHDFDIVWQKTLDASLAIKKDAINSEFTNEFNYGESSSRLHNLTLLLANNNYSEAEKSELIIESLERGILYNILAFNFDKRAEIIDFYAQRELKRELYKILYSYFFYHRLLEELKQKNLLTSKLQDKLNQELQSLDLLFIALTNENGKTLEKILPKLPKNFYKMPKNPLLEAVNSNIGLATTYNQDYIKIADAVSEQLPPYATMFDKAIKFNELLFQAPKTLYQKYSNELFIQSDCSKIFGIIGIDCELELIQSNLKKLELDYAIKHNEYMLSEKNADSDAGEKFLELKKIELARFKAFLFLYFLVHENNPASVNNDQQIPSNIRFLLEKTILDIVKENLFAAQ
ncbi:MAG: hypothetical protein IJW31_01010 [Lentisphaeria bacterium]|nr:hypothetical protein [Lentisphaeria bacterium]